MNNIIVDASHPMASSNTGDPLVFRNSIGNYMSRKAYLSATIPTITTKERRTDNDYHLLNMARLSPTKH